MRTGNLQGGDAQVNLQTIQAVRIIQSNDLFKGLTLKQAL
jgi:hemin uptake protein HemP